MKDNKFYIKKEKIELSRERPAKVTICGDIIIIEVNTSKEYQVEKDKKLDKDCLFESATKRVRNTNIKKITNYQKNSSNLRIATKKANRLILTNFDNDNSWFITLTYSNERYNEKLLNSRIKYFFKKLKNLFATKEIVYMYFPEHQRVKRKTLNAYVMHYHIILRVKDNDAIDITQTMIRKIWKYGSVNVKKVYDIDGLSNYVCAFLPHNSLKYLTKKEQKSHLKKYSKLYICSKNIERPISFVMTLSKAYDMISKLDCKQIEYYSCSLYMYDKHNSEDVFINHYRKSVYRRL